METAKGTGATRQVLEFLDNVVDETVMKVLATEVNSGLDLEDTFLDSQELLHLHHKYIPLLPANRLSSTSS
jgi:hypothetical protein